MYVFLFQNAEDHGFITNQSGADSPHHTSIHPVADVSVKLIIKRSGPAWMKMFISCGKVLVGCMAGDDI